MANNNQKTRSRKQGFASMDEDHQYEIASEGGRAAHEKGSAYEFSAEESGKKGGEKGHEINRSNAQSEPSKRRNQSGSENTRGGSSEQHSKAGQQSHKNNLEHDCQH